MDRKKRVIQEYWTRNVPGLDMVSKGLCPEQKEFYEDVDNFRYKNEPYVMPLIDSFAKKGKLILEVGCGMGTDSRYIVKKGANVVSLDLSLNNVSFALKGMSLSGLKGCGVNADAEKLPFKDDSFDVVYSYGVLHHTPNTQEAIHELHRVLKPGGKSIVLLYHKGYAYYAILFAHGYKHLLGIKSKEEVMSEYDNTPLSKLYSKKEVKHMFQEFNNVEILMFTYGGIQRHPVLKYVYRAFQKNRFLMNNFGSFIVIRGEK